MVTPKDFTPDELDTLIEAAAAMPQRKPLFHEVVTGTRAERDAIAAAHRETLEAIYTRTCDDLHSAGLCFADLIAYDFQNR